MRIVGGRFSTLGVHPGAPRLRSHARPGDAVAVTGSLGASAWYTFRRVTFPIIRPGVLAGAFFAFMSSFDNVPVSLFLADERTEVLPIHLWQQIETNLDVRTAAVSGVIVVITLLLMLVAERFAGLTSQMR